MVADRDRPAAGALAHRAQRVLQLLQGGVGAAEQAFPLGGEGQRAMAAAEQPGPQLLLQRLHLAADRRLGQAQFARGLGDAQPPSDGDEAAQQVQRRQTVQVHSHSSSACV